MGFRKNLWIEAGGTENVERQISMRNEAVPEIQGGARVANTQTGDEVILVGLDGAFGGVCAMQVQRNELEIDAGIAQKCFRLPGHSLSRI